MRHHCKRKLENSIKKTASGLKAWRRLFLFEDVDILKMNYILCFFALYERQGISGPDRRRLSKGGVSLRDWARTDEAFPMRRDPCEVVCVNDDQEACRDNPCRFA